MNKIPQNDNRLYHITANWKNNNNEHFSREFVICAADKTTAETIAKNHIPQTLTKNMAAATSTAIADCKLRTRDLGIAQKNRTYFGSIIQNTQRDNIDELSPTEITISNLNSLWGQEIGYLSHKTSLAPIEKNRLNAMTKTNNVATMLYQWTEEYLMSKNTDIITFFETKLSDYTNNEIKRSESPIINNDTTTQEDLKLVLNQAKKQADLFLKNTNEMADSILAQANNTAAIIKQNALNEVQTLISVTETLIESKLAQAQQALYDATIATHEATALTDCIHKLYNDACSNQYGTMLTLQKMHDNNGTPLFDLLYKPEKTDTEQATTVQIVKTEHIIAQPDELTNNLINNEDISNAFANIANNAATMANMSPTEMQNHQNTISNRTSIKHEHANRIETAEKEHAINDNCTDVKEPITNNSVKTDELIVDAEIEAIDEPIIDDNVETTDEPIIDETPETTAEPIVDNATEPTEDPIIDDNIEVTEKPITATNIEPTDESTSDNNRVNDMPMDIIEELAEEIIPNAKNTESSMTNTEITASVKTLDDIPIDDINELATKLREHDFWLQEPYISHNPYGIGMGDVVYNLYTKNKVKDMLRNTHFHISLVNMIGKKRPDLYYQKCIIQLESTLPTNCINEEYTYKLKGLLRYIQDILFLCIPNDNSRNYKNAFEPLALQALDELTQTVANNQPTNNAPTENQNDTDDTNTFETNDFADAFGDDFDEYDEENEDITPDYGEEYESQKANSN